MSADTLISRMDKVRRSGQGRWMCKCPAHEDKNASLSIRELDDGRVLLHCFAGCSVHEVVASVGMDMQDLFPPKLGDGQHTRPAERRPFPAADVLRALALESKIVALVARRIKNNEPVSSQDYERTVLACSRIEAGMQAAGVGHV